MGFGICKRVNNILNDLFSIENFPLLGEKCLRVDIEIQTNRFRAILIRILYYIDFGSYIEENCTRVNVLIANNNIINTQS